MQHGYGFARVRFRQLLEHIQRGNFGGVSRLRQNVDVGCCVFPPVLRVGFAGQAVEKITVESGL